MNKLSADPLALILGILALVIGIASCCCYGLTAIVPLAMSIIGLVVANKSLRDFRETPDVYDPQSRNNVNTAKIINIIALVINGLIVLIAAGVLIFYGTMLSSVFLDEFKDFENDDFYQNDEFYHPDSESDTINTWNDEENIIERDGDSINIDSMYQE
ncbi:CCC motif membrane protein [Winogradskyella bathintestinalis]|uniref:CCC motif membrane protein n=1 Tax=Winogradskyella bathintestinalis TaxID=3035208 RepID=A0ABT7ZS47_9FLAO|nr:CCC motif membrane protein [Winogradskyella bathintestinalis]MDN3491808.1 CCC motif membrane protein [Winogradskyella bathintestinalis]